MKVEWSVDATTDLADIVEYIGARNPRGAAQLDTILSAAAARLADFPKSGRAGEIAGAREIFPHRRYRLVYTLADDTIWIEAIVHTSRQWPPVEDES